MAPLSKTTAEQGAHHKPLDRLTWSIAIPDRSDTPSPTSGLTVEASTAAAHHPAADPLTCLGPHALSDPAKVSVTRALLLLVRGMMGVHMLTAGRRAHWPERQVAEHDARLQPHRTRSRLRQASASRSCAAAAGLVTTCPSTLKTCRPTGGRIPTS